jgi:hypothetical protein
VRTDYFADQDDAGDAAEADGAGSASLGHGGSGAGIGSLEITGICPSLAIGELPQQLTIGRKDNGGALGGREKFYRIVVDNSQPGLKVQISMQTIDTNGEAVNQVFGYDLDVDSSGTAHFQQRLVSVGSSGAAHIKQIESASDAP